MIRLELTDGAAPTVNRDDSFHSIFECFPNPSNGIFYVRGPQVHWKIKDIHGRDISVEQNENQLYIKNVAAGMYFLETFWQGKLFVHKIMIQP